MWVQPGACNPARNKACVLPSGHALSRTPGTRKQKFARLLSGHLQEGINGFAGVVGQFEADRTPRLFLTYCRTRDCIPVGSNVFDLERDDIASAQLAVDGQIK